MSRRVSLNAALSLRFQRAFASFSNTMTERRVVGEPCPYLKKNINRSLMLDGSCMNAPF
jgi:hypothetical protein